jgi:hypothetical protein
MQWGSANLRRGTCKCFRMCYRSKLWCQQLQYQKRQLNIVVREASENVVQPSLYGSLLCCKRNALGLVLFTFRLDMRQERGIPVSLL